MRIHRRWGLPVGIAALAFSVVTAVPAHASTVPRVDLPSPNRLDTTGTVHPLDANLQLALRVYLRDRAGLEAAAKAASNPADPRYGQFLTPTQVNNQYGATAAQTTAVRTWLAEQGMTITATTLHYIAVKATVAQVDTTFDTRVSEFDTVFDNGPKGGTFTQRKVGVQGGFSVPAAVADEIASVTGIDQVDLNTTSVQRAAPAAGPSHTRTAHVARQAAASDVPCSQYWAQYARPIPAAFGHTTAPTQLCGYTPQQIRRAYGLTSSPYTGKGTTIAVILNGHSTTELADSNRFFAGHGEPTFTTGQYTESVDPDVDSTCEALNEPSTDPEEESIDVQTAHLAAPDASIVYIGVACAITEPALAQTWLDGVTGVVDRHLADVATGSWGLAETTLAPADMAPWDSILQQGALEGIGFNFSSGDGGDFDVDDPSGGDVHDPQFPAVDPWSTAVGGTSVFVGENGSVVGDYAWGDNLTPINEAGTGYDEVPPGEFDSGSGGGVSTVFTQPDYQKVVVPAGLATSNGTAPAARVMPDISADAGNSWLIGFTDSTDGTFEVLPFGGGTSGSSPLIAGIEADAVQAAGHPLGFANPVLYRLVGSKALRDILPVNPADPPIALGARGATIDPTLLTTFGEDLTLTAARGYDDSTGLGAPTTVFVSAFRRR